MATKHRTYKVTGFMLGHVIPNRTVYTDDFKQSVRIGTYWQQDGYTVSILTWNETTQKYEKR